MSDRHEIGTHPTTTPAVLAGSLRIARRETSPSPPVEGWAHRPLAVAGVDAAAPGAPAWNPAPDLAPGETAGRRIAWTARRRISGSARRRIAGTAEGRIAVTAGRHVAETAGPRTAGPRTAKPRAAGPHTAGTAAATGASDRIGRAG